MKWFYASYKMGGGMSNAELFRREFIDKLNNYDMAWVLEHDRPYGIVYGLFIGNFIVVGNTQWLEWATKRNKIEGFVKLLNELRKEEHVLGWCTHDDKAFFNYICKHGIARRVGTIYEDQTLCLYQTRMPEWVISKRQEKGLIDNSTDQ